MKIRKLNEASEGFQKEFYKGYVILKNRAGDGWDIYSYEGTPEKVKRAVKEEEGLATLKDAKATIDRWAGKASLNEGGYKITIEQDGKTFDDYCYDYREESAIAQMKAKYGDNIEIKNVEAHNKVNEGIEVTTIADYITDHYDFDDIDDKYSCINSIRDSFKGQKTISKEELEQFIGSHNGRDKVNESKSINDTCTRYKVEYYPEGSEDREVDYIYADNKDDARKQLVSKTKAEGIDYIMITAMIPEEVPTSYRDNDLKESKLKLNESLFKEDFDDDKYTASRYLDAEVPDICAKVLEMLDVLPSHKATYITKICRDFYAKIESIISSYTMTNESLHEDVTDVVTDTLAGPTEGPESGLASLLNTAVQDEFKTIQMYNDIAVSARAEGFEDIATVVDEINTEENKHVGQLQELLKTVSPNAKAIDTGEIEGKQQVDEVTEIVEEDINNSNSSPNNNIEEDGKDMKESWEEVYQSFKTIEKELNGDGEAITATIDQLYRDNKGNPDYEKAYKKWAAGE